MAIYDEHGELIGYRFTDKPVDKPVHYWYVPGTRVIFAKVFSAAEPVAVSVG